MVLDNEVNEIQKAAKKLYRHFPLSTNSFETQNLQKTLSIIYSHSFF
jgi:hypothetical protein